MVPYIGDIPIVLVLLEHGFIFNQSPAKSALNSRQILLSFMSEKLKIFKQETPNKTQQK